MSEALLEHLVRGIVSDQDAVTIAESERHGEPALSVQVAQGDRGAVIGRQGRTIRALEAVLKAAAGQSPVPSLEVVDED